MRRGQGQGVRLASGGEQRHTGGERPSTAEPTMAFTLYDAASPIFVRGLNSLSGILDRAAASGLDEATLIAARLAPDMKPLADQIDMATFSARGCVARLAGLEVPTIAGSDATFAQMQDRIARSIAFIEGVTAPRSRAPQPGGSSYASRRRAGFRRRGLSDQLRPAQLPFPRHDRLRHPAPAGRGAGQARLSGQAGPDLTGPPRTRGADKTFVRSYMAPHIVRPASDGAV